MLLLLNHGLYKYSILPYKNHLEWLKVTFLYVFKEQSEQPFISGAVKTSSQHLYPLNFEFFEKNLFVKGGSFRNQSNILNETNELAGMLILLTVNAAITNELSWQEC